jgi:hypothetical protein
MDRVRDAPLGLQRFDLQSQAHRLGLLYLGLLGGSQAGAQPAARKREPQRRIVRPGAQNPPAGASVPDEILIVASRLKDYVQAQSGMSTSDRVLGPFSDIVRDFVDRAIENARREGRRTVLDRDVPGA